MRSISAWIFLLIHRPNLVDMLRVFSQTRAKLVASVHISSVGGGLCQQERDECGGGGEMARSHPGLWQWSVSCNRGSSLQSNHSTLAPMSCCCNCCHSLSLTSLYKDRASDFSITINTTGKHFMPVVVIRLSGTAQMHIVVFSLKKIEKAKCLIKTAVAAHSMADFQMCN